MAAKRQVITGLCLLAGMGLAVSSDSIRGLVFAPAQDSIARPGMELPHLPVVDTRGKPEDLKNAARGGKRVIVFYSGACDTCRMVLPELAPFPPGVRLLMVHEGADESFESPANLGLAHAEVFLDRNGVFRRSFSMPALPTILFVDERGILLHGLVGAHARGRVQEKLKEFAARR